MALELDSAGEVPGFTVTVRRSLTEPILLGGAPRAIAILNGTIAAAIEALGPNGDYVLVSTASDVEPEGEKA